MSLIRLLALLFLLPEAPCWALDPASSPSLSGTRQPEPGVASPSDLALGLAAVDIQRTVLRVRLHPDQGRLEAEGEVTLLARREDVKSVPLVLADAFGIAEFRFEDAARPATFRPCRWANARARLWEVSLPRPAGRGTKVTVAFRYAGEPDWPLDGRVTPRLSWMLPQAAWYPRLGTGRVAEDDASEIDLTLTAPAAQVIVASDRRSIGPAFFVAGDLAPVETSTWNGKPLTWYAPLMTRFPVESQRQGRAVFAFDFHRAPRTENREPERSDRAPSPLAEVRRLLDAQAGLFGGFPQPRLAVLQLPEPWPRGESVAAPGALLFDAQPPDAARLAHELAHQWWGMAVQTPLLEGLATYAEWRFGPRRPDPGGAYLDFVRSHPDLAIREALYRFEEPQRRALAYDKLAAVLVMLEDVMEPERFGRLLREFHRQNAGRRTRLEEFQSLARRLSRRDLDGFFNQWVQQPGLPAVQLTTATARAEGRGFRLRLALAQARPPFHLSTLLAVTTTAGRERHRVTLSGTEQQVEIDCRARPIAVELDPERRLLLDRRESLLSLSVTEAM